MREQVAFGFFSHPVSLPVIEDLNWAVSFLANGMIRVYQRNELGIVIWHMYHDFSRKSLAGLIRDCRASRREAYELIHDLGRDKIKEIAAMRTGGESYDHIREVQGIACSDEYIDSIVKLSTMLIFYKK